MNKKGQALIEFILIIPIFTLIMLAAFDWVRILQTKTSLEDKLNNYINYAKEDSAVTYTIDKKEDYYVYTASEDVSIYSPLLTPIISSNYNVKVERTTYE